MWLKVVVGLCFFKALSQVTEAQRSWGKPQNSYSSSNIGYSSWGSNGGTNALSNKQNSKYGSWDLNVESNVKPTSNPYLSGNSNSYDSNSYEKSVSGNNYDSWNSNSNRDKPSNFNSGNNWNNYDTTTESRKNSGWNSNYESNNDEKLTSSLNSNSWESNSGSNSNSGNTWSGYRTTTEGRKKSGWNSNKSTTNKTPKKQKTNSGSSENWESEAFSTNNRPGEKKLASIMNSPSLGKWDTNSNLNTFSSNNNNNDNDNSIYSSSWETSNTDTFNSNTGWGSNSLGNNDLNSNEIFSSSDNEDNALFPSYNSNKNKKPTSASNWGNDNSKKDKNSGNSGWNSNNNKQNNNNNINPSNSNNSGNQNSNNWDSNSSMDNKPNKELPSSQPSGTEEQNQPSQKKDHSVLDELDKNEWYFGSGTNYPNPPLKSSLNIDVSELWNFDKRRKAGQTFGENSNSKNSNKNNKNNNNNNNNSGNKRRRNRQAQDYDTGVECTCVDVNLCEDEDMIISQYDLKNDWRPLEEFQCSSLTEVCCTKPKTGQRSRLNIAMDLLHCGQRRPVNIFGALDESVAQPGEFPWNLKIADSESDKNCSASLIHTKMAITAAHCVDSVLPSSLKVIAGLWNPNKEPFQSRRVMKIILHPDYYSANPRNDIALLILENPFKLTDNVNTVCLPVTNDKWDLNDCVVAGWRPKEINGENFEVLEKSTVTFLPQQDCQNIMLVTDFWREYILHDSFVCGIEKNKKTKCLGDEGSPVICPSINSPDTYLQVGIVSNRMNCDSFGRPGIFTNVLKFLDWVNENAFDLGLFDDIDVRTLM